MVLPPVRISRKYRPSYAAARLVSRAASLLFCRIIGSVTVLGMIGLKRSSPSKSSLNP